MCNLRWRELWERDLAESDLSPLQERVMATGLGAFRLLTSSSAIESTRMMSFLHSLFLAQSLHRVDLSRAQCGHVTGQQR
jgi:hypothetical protein